MLLAQWYLDLRNYDYAITWAYEEYQRLAVGIDQQKEALKLPQIPLKDQYELLRAERWRYQVLLVNRNPRVTEYFQQLTDPAVYKNKLFCSTNFIRTMAHAWAKTRYEEYPDEI